jgi:DNA-binding HxlR family transcriptional regulator
VILLEGPARFVELASAVPGLSGRVMTERLRDLQDAGLVQRTVDPGPPITSSYRLTAGGELLRSALVALSRWAQGWDQARSAS